MDDIQQMIDFISEEHGLNVLALMPCHQVEVPDFEPVVGGVWKPRRPIEQADSFGAGQQDRLGGCGAADHGLPATLL